MKFYGREAELAALEKAFQRGGADLAIISGRRRIGKTRLVDEFLKGKNSVRLVVVPKEERQVARDFEEEIRKNAGYSPEFGSFRGGLEYVFEKQIGVLFLDEFPNVLQVNKAIPFEVQKLWDENKDSADTLVIVSGSYAGMMAKIFTKRKAPLFNRATLTIDLKPLSFPVIAKLLDDLLVSRAEEQIGYYCIFGGVPYYYLLLEKMQERKLSNAVEGLFFEEGAQLKDEGENILKQEFGNAYAKYYAILESIHAGFTTANEISQKTGERSTTLSKYVKALQQEYKLVSRAVPFNENPLRSKKGRYYLLDNTLAFWFGFVNGRRKSPTGDELNAFIGKRFELLCMEFLASRLEKAGERVKKIGKWWGNVETASGFEPREIDIVVETGSAIYYGECKWTDKKVGEKELGLLKENAKAVNGNAKPAKYVLFSKKGFTISENSELRLFNAERIVRESKLMKEK